MTYTKMRDETEAEHIARDMREGRFPERSEPQMVPREVGGMYMHPGYKKLYPIQTVLRDLASQEGCDGEPYDAMVTTAALIEQMLPWVKLGVAVMQDWPEVVDIEGHWLQDVAEEAGVLIAVDGGFDPAIHHDPMGDAEAGDDWFQIIKRPVLE